MKNLNKLVKRIEKDIDAISESVSEPVNSVIEFVKGHKKLIIILVVIYLTSRFLFSEEE